MYIVVQSNDGVSKAPNRYGQDPKSVTEKHKHNEIRRSVVQTDMVCPCPPLGWENRMATNR